jgi:large subunit ribosomal protein L23
MDNPYKIILKPLITEKGTLLQEEENSYCFLVHPRASKTQISKAIESLFDVNVVRVNTMVRKGKWKGIGHRAYQRANYKRALVKLKEGEAIEFI